MKSVLKRAVYSTLRTSTFMHVYWLRSCMCWKSKRIFSAEMRRKCSPPRVTPHEHSPGGLRQGAQLNGLWWLTSELGESTRETEAESWSGRVPCFIRAAKHSNTNKSNRSLLSYGLETRRPRSQCQYMCLLPRFGRETPCHACSPASGSLLTTLTFLGW